MTYLVSKKIKGHNYWYAVESARVDGKSKRIKQIYLGTLENMVAAKKLSQNDVIPYPLYANTLEFGAYAALFDLSERLTIRQTINEYAGNSPAGAPIGDALVLAAINMAASPDKNNAFDSGWFSKTVLPNLFPQFTEGKTDDLAETPLFEKFGPADFGGSELFQISLLRIFAITKAKI
jgi:hypothetical protein